MGLTHIVRTSTGFDKRRAEIVRAMVGSTLGGVFRTMLAAVLLVVLLPALVVANASEWAARTVVDDQAFTTTAGRVMDTPALRAVVADRISGQVVDALLTNPITARVVATEILGLGADATAPQIETAIRSRIAVALIRRSGARGTR